MLVCLIHLLLEVSPVLLWLRMVTTVATAAAVVVAAVAWVIPGAADQEQEQEPPLLQAGVVVVEALLLVRLFLAGALRNPLRSQRTAHRSPTQRPLRGAGTSSKTWQVETNGSQTTVTATRTWLLKSFRSLE